MLSSIALVTMGLLVLVGLSIILSFVVRETRALVPVQRAKRQSGNHSAHKGLISDLHAESTASAQLRSKKISDQPAGHLPFDSASVSSRQDHRGG
jgi:hypothetical protein